MSLRFAGGLFHVVRRAGAPEETRADESLRDEANGRGLVLSAGGGGGVVNEQQIEVEDYAEYKPKSKTFQEMLKAIGIK